MWALLAQCTSHSPVIHKCQGIINYVSLLIVPASSVVVTASSVGTATAGSQYSIICAVTRPATLLTEPDITWVSPGGVAVSSLLVNTTQLGSTTVASATLHLDPLLVSNSGLYTCQASVSSPALVPPLNLTTSLAVTITSKLSIRTGNWYAPIGNCY